ncbi:MAG: PhoU domain-containing protein, partial [Burkholderiales bacterium]
RLLVADVADAGSPLTTVVLFYLGLNLAIGIVFLGLTHPVARVITALVPRPPKTERGAARASIHLDPSALATPSLALACASREALHLADQVETMLSGLLSVIKNDDLELSQKLRELDNAIDQLYSAIGRYLTRLSRESLDEEESRRWSNTMAFVINMEQAGDIAERVLADIENKKIKRGRTFTEGGMIEITDLHSRLLDNLHLATSVFLTNNLRDAQRLLEERARFRDLEHVYENSHLTRLANRTLHSVETSSLHIELIGELKRINSHVCSIAYPILDAALGGDPGRMRRTPVDGVNE